MASEEDLHNQAQMPAPPPSTLPPYPEMILAAIQALNEENGSNKSAISKHIAQFIETNYGPIPPAHSALLTHHLNKMKSSGQLQFIKNNYVIPDPNSPPRRGRGRPPKPKAPVSPGAVLLSPRPRGRPPKSRDPSAPTPPPKPKAAPAATNLSGKKRGRPPKVAAVPDSASAAAVTAAAPAPPAPAPATGGAPRGRGRPPKVKPAVAAPVGA